MCGIVGYFGSTGNNLTRPLAAMSAIGYRAPDSSGIGFFGDDAESIRTLKAIGSVERLLETLLAEKAYPDRIGQLMALWTPESAATDFKAHQRRLLQFEGFPTEILEALEKGKKDYPSFDQLLDTEASPRRSIFPGQPGRVDPLPVFFIRSTGDLRNLIEELITQYDLPALAIQTLIRKALKEAFDTRGGKALSETDPEEILTAFDGLFTEIFWEDCQLDLNRTECGRFAKSPSVEKTLWGLLSKTPIAIPADFDRDGVRGVFRLLDAVLLSRLPQEPELESGLQAELEAFWPEAARHQRTGIDWKTLYQAEKGVQLYGWAAAAALAHLRQNTVPAAAQSSSPESSATAKAPSGQTDPISLRYLSPPIISHGRWALHSAVTVANAHPFVDASGQRAIVLNGQFSTTVEEEAEDFLQRVAGYSFRSQNSTEYFALLWGYYAELLEEEQRRFERIRLQVEADLTGYVIGSQNIDYETYQQIRGKSAVELEEMAFVQAAQRMIRDGGQLAVAGISLLSPRCLLVATHNQPVFVVRHPDTRDFMVVSDVNAALGLFPQSLIHSKSLELHALRREQLEALQDLRQSEADNEALARAEKAFAKRRAEILAAFRVTVYPMEGEKIFARIETGLQDNHVTRQARFTDFDGNPLHEVKSFRVDLDPLRAKKDLFKSFYESHLDEVPERLHHLLNVTADDSKQAPHLELREGILHRRFGNDFVRLKRLLLVGMGSSHNAGLMAREFLQRLLPEVEVLVLRPIELENIPDAVVPERDLVVLLSWSSTTADMVHFARTLEEHRAIMLGITNKRFADMAMIAAKSAGVMQVLGGEEITIAAVKSTFCMLLAIDLLGLWLRSKLGGGAETARRDLAELQRIPGILAQMLHDRALTEFARDLAARSGKSYACFIFDALESTAAGHEIALKLQDNSWSAMGKRLDYHNLLIHACRADMKQHLVLVNATHAGRLHEALNVMKRLYLDGIPFAAVSYAHSREADVRYYSNNLCINLPKVDDCLQPFVDLLFHYRLAYHYGTAHGRTAEDSPRNRTKSVTVTRTRFKKMFSREREMQLLEEKASRLLAKLPGPPPPLYQETRWERSAAFQREAIYYREMRQLTEAMSQGDFAGTFLQSPAGRLADLTRAIFQGLPEEGEIVFVSADRNAHAAAKNVVVQWGRFLEYYLRVAPQGESLDHFKEETVLIFVATKPPEPKVLARILKNVRVPCAWIGPTISGKAVRFFEDSLGYFPFSDEFQEIRNELVYAGVNSLLLAACRQNDPDKAQVLEQYFKHSRRLVEQILNDDSLQQSIRQAMTANSQYPSAFFSGPPGSTGLAWVERFDQLECLPLEAYLYGESGHGPLVTVDPRVDKKFIPLGNRREMVASYGEEQVAAWERLYLDETDIDGFLERQEEDAFTQITRPFFAQGQWYIPVLQPGYDAREDNLIIVDATSERNFDRALDELSTYGARYARMLVITQRGFLDPGKSRALQEHPLSHLILLPALGDQADGMPIPGLLLPLAMNLVGMQLAAAATEARRLSFEPISEESIFRESFGVLGQTLVQHGIDLGWLNHRLIESLKLLTPVVTAVEGIGRYQVREIRSERQLHDLADRGRLQEPEKTLSDFKTQRTHKTPFYLLLPDRESFTGRVFELAERTFRETGWELWHQVYGDTWSVFYSRDPDLIEISETESMLMIPFAEGPRGGGRIYHLCLRCSDWDRLSPLDEQIAITVRALGGQSAALGPISTRYREIVGYFNADTASQHHSWDDRLLMLVRRPLLFGKTSRETARLLVDRVEELLGLLKRHKRPEHIREITVLMEKAWPALEGTTAGSDLQRWNVLQEQVRGHLRNSESQER